MTYILAVNAGSSSLKFAAYRIEAHPAEPQLWMSGQVSNIGVAPVFQLRDRDGSKLDGSRYLDGVRGVADAAGAVPAMVQCLSDAGIANDAIAATAHRLVHGGARFSAPLVVNDGLAGELDQLATLAPLHMPAGLAVLRAVRGATPDALHLACFDTAFHATQPDVAVRVALPAIWREKGYRRYGFHGLNYEHVVAALPVVSGEPLAHRLLVFHLGNGASACAIKNGHSVATTMGYSPLDGLVMGTRTGALDPGVVLALLREPGMNGAKLERLLWRESGLLGLSGVTSDMRALLARADPVSRQAIESFCYSAAYHAGGLVSAMGGLDAIVFTGGIGENAAAVRADIIGRLSWLGVALDPVRNETHAGRLSPEDAEIGVWLVPADEEGVLSRHAARALMAG